MKTLSMLYSSIDGLMGRERIKQFCNVLIDNAIILYRELSTILTLTLMRISIQIKRGCHEQTQIPSCKGR